jgi:hypothetical protein
MGEVISVFEYDLLGSGKAASVGAKLVPQQVFNYLEALSLASIQGSQFLKLTSLRLQIASGAKLRAGCFQHLTVSSLRYCPRLVKTSQQLMRENIADDAKPSAWVSTYSNPTGNSAGSAHAFA